MKPELKTPPRFHHEEDEGTSNKYTSTVTPHFSPKRAANGQSRCFKKPQEHTTKKPNTIILTDWASTHIMTGADATKIQNYYTTIKILLQNNHTIYVPVNNELVQITMRNLMIVTEPHDVISDQEAYKLSLKLNIPRKKTSILNHIEMQKLQNDLNLTNENTSIKIDELLKTPMSLAKIIDLIPKECTIEVNTISIESERLLEELKKTLPNEFLINIKYLNFSYIEQYFNFHNNNKSVEIIFDNNKKIILQLLRIISKYKIIHESQYYKLLKRTNELEYSPKNINLLSEIQKEIYSKIKDVILIIQNSNISDIRKYKKNIPYKFFFNGLDNELQADFICDNKNWEQTSRIHNVLDIIEIDNNNKLNLIINITFNFVDPHPDLLENIIGYTDYAKETNIKIKTPITPKDLNKFSKYLLFIIKELKEITHLANPVIFENQFISNKFLILSNDILHCKSQKKMIKMLADFFIAKSKKDILNIHKKTPHKKLYDMYFTLYKGNLTIDKTYLTQPQNLKNKLLECNIANQYINNLTLSNQDNTKNKYNIKDSCKILLQNINTPLNSLTISNNTSHFTNIELINKFQPKNVIVHLLLPRIVQHEQHMGKLENDLNIFISKILSQPISITKNITFKCNNNHILKIVYIVLSKYNLTNINLTIEIQHYTIYNIETLKAYIYKHLEDVSQEKFGIKKASAISKAHNSANTTEFQAHMDSNTNLDPNVKHNQRQIFYEIKNKTLIPLSTFHYRLMVYDEIIMYKTKQAKENVLKLNHNTEYAFKKSNYTFFNSKKKFMQHITSKNNRLLGTHKINLSFTWQPLPSFVTHEKLHSICIEDIKTNNIEIKYCEKYKQYFIRTHSFSDKEVEVLFDISIIKNTMKFAPQTKSNLPQKALAIIKKYNNFTPKNLEIAAKVTTEEYLKAVIEQKTGACRIRAMACKYELETTFPDVNVNIIVNDSHAFIEINYQNEISSFDLGGYPAEQSKHQAKLNKTQTSKLNNLLDQSELEEKEEAEFNRQFATWTDKQSYHSATEFNLKLFSESKNLLVKHNDSNTLYNLQLQIMQHAVNLKRPIFIIDSPDDLVCQSNWIDERGNIKKGPGGKLYDFLTAHKPPSKPILLVNWDNFNASDIIAFNSLTDNCRYADGEPVPDNYNIIGLYNFAKENAYNGSDFTSRYNKIFDANHIASYVKKDFDSKEFLNDKNIEDSYVIDLFESDDWQSKLIGHFKINQNKLAFTSGELKLALQSGKKIILKNAPWSNIEFTKFWHKWFITKNLSTPIGNIEIDPSLLSFGRSYGYEWENINQNIQLSSVTKSAQYTLNPSNFKFYMKNFVITKGNISTTDGWIKEKKIHTVILTRNLEKNQWAELLTYCQQNNITLNVQVPHKVKVPNYLHGHKTEEDTVSPHIFTTNDLDYTIYSLRKNGKIADNDIIINVSETEISNLLFKINSISDQTTTEMQFTIEQSDIIKDLILGNNIVLTGKFTKPMQDALSDLLYFNKIWFNNKEYKLKGKLTIITNNENSFNFAKKEKLNFEEERKEEQEEKTFAQQEYDNQAWNGLINLPPSKNFEFQLSNQNIEEYCRQKAEEFDKTRLIKINDSLKKSPYVFISGETGIGKSTFISKVLAKQKNIEVIYEMSGLIEYINKHGNVPENIRLFIDEANTEITDYNIFEGLFNNKQQKILINNKIVEFKGKVIFAGNPSNYGDRNLPKLFNNRPNVVIFEKLTPEYIYDRIIKTILINIPINQHKKIVNIMFKMYNEILNSSHKILISPRELQFIAMLIAKNYTPGKKIEDLTKESCYLVIKDIVKNPESILKIKPIDYKIKYLGSNYKILGNKIPKFVIPPSKLDIYHKLNELLEIRKIKIKKDNYSGGLNAILLEGNPAAGKTEFLLKSLTENGYHKGNFTNEDLIYAENIFYHLPIKMDNTTKERLLVKAFKEGAIVVIDEINSQPMLTKLLNSLLMGEYNGKFYKGINKKNGFTVLGTKNPASMDARNIITDDVARRAMTYQFTDYTTKELYTIVEKGFNKPKITAKNVVDDFIKTRKYAIDNQLFPIPTLRSLFRYVKPKSVKSENKKLHQVSKNTDNLFKQTKQKMLFKSKMILKQSIKNKHKLTY